MPVTAQQGSGGRKKPDPRSASQKRADRANATANEASEMWASAYEKLDDPTILFVFGLNDGDAEAQLGRTLTEDQFAFTSALQTGIQRHMERAYPDTDVLDAESMRLIDADVADTIAHNINNPNAALKTLKETFQSDVVIWAKFVPLETGNYRVLCVLLDDRGRSRGVGDGWTLDPNGDFRGQTAGMFMAIAEAFHRMANRTWLRYKFSLLGVEDFGKTNEIGSRIKTIPGVKGNVKPKFKRGTPFSAGTLQIKYDGELSELAYHLQTLLEVDMGYEVTGLSYDASGVLMQVTPTQFKRAPAWKVLSDAKIADTKKLREKFRAAYSAKDSKRVGVVLLEQVRIPQTEDQADPLPTSNLQTPFERSSAVQAMENAVAQALGELGVAVAETNALYAKVVARLLKEQREELKPITGDEGPKYGRMKALTEVGQIQVLDEARKEARWDIVLLGQVTTDGQGSTPPGLLTYSFRMFNVENENILASVRWAPNTGSGDLKFPVNRDAPEKVAGYIAGRLADQWYRLHLLLTSDLRVTITGASLTYDNVDQVAKLCRSSIVGVEDVANVEFNADTKQGGFRIKYIGNYNDLIDKIAVKQEMLQVDLITDKSTSSILNLRFKPIGG